MDPSIPNDNDQRMQHNYQYYDQHHDPNAYAMQYNPQMSPYQVMQPQTRPLAVSEIQQQGQQMPYHPLGLITTSNAPYGSNVYSTSPPHGAALAATPPPPSPDMYDPLSPPVSGSDTSADGLYHHSNSSGANSPSSSRSSSLVHRHPIRYNPTPSPTSSSGRHRRDFSQDSDDDDMRHVENLAHTRKEATRRQRIEAEQRRRDELRDGYAKLKDVLPVSNQKSSKVSLLERATNRIVALEKENQELQARLESIHEEVQRLQVLNEKISLSSGGTGTPSPGHFNVRPLSPPPDTPLHPSRKTNDPPPATPPPSDQSC